jgi:sensor histidine kinase YesM
MDHNTNILTSPKFRVAWHILFWSMAVVFMILFFGHQQKEYLYTFYFVGILLPITMLTTYLLIYYLVPRFLMQRHYLRFAAWSFSTILLSFYLGTMAIFMMLFFFMFGDGPQMDPTTVDIYFLAVGMYFVVLAAVAIKLFKLWYEKQKTERILEKGKLEAELNMLKSQIHPHFLFNTLNNIYSLALQKSDAAPEMLVKLSDILHYILYECNAPFVTLEKEITLLINYMELERIRYGKRLELLWSVPERIPDIQLAPMILLPFVENAFKHGASKTRDRATISITLFTEGKTLTFQVQNNKPAIKTDPPGNHKHGLGLKNVRQRLEIIYKDRFQLEIDDSGDQFKIGLMIDTEINST